MNEEFFVKNNRGKWAEPGVPHKGWKCIDIEDLEEPSLTCEMCESQVIRYVHYMKHPDYEGVLRVGCICAGHMEENLERSKKRDDFMKSRADKRKRWLTRNWKISKKGNEYIKTDGFRIIIFYSNGIWKALIESESGDFKEWSRRKYKTKDEVKLSAFDYLTKILAEQQNG
jgi:hypothetical protein